MAHIRKEERGVKMYDLALYAIVSPFDSKKIFISKTGKNRLYKTYSEHVSLRITKTKELFEQSRNQNLLPPMYLLESARMTKEEAFRRSVAWLKYFMDHGYEQITKDIMTEYALDLKEETKEYYKYLCAEPIGNVLQPDDGLFPNYGSRTEQKKENGNTVISIYVNPDEYEQIKKSADENDLSMAAYCKKMTLEGTITKVDLSFIDKELDEYQSSKSLLRQILFSFHESGNYYPADMQVIQNCVDRFTALQEELCDKFTELIHNLR